MVGYQSKNNKPVYNRIFYYFIYFSKKPYNPKNNWVNW
jgi:hypothetical protein